MKLQTEGSIVEFEVNLKKEKLQMTPDFRLTILDQIRK